MGLNLVGSTPILRTHCSGTVNLAINYEERYAHRIDGGEFNGRTKETFQSESRMECAELVLDHGYSVCEAAEAMDVGKSTVGK